MHALPFAFRSQRRPSLPQALLLCGVLLLAGSCQSEAPNVGATADDIAGDPSEFVGQQVAVSGEVDDVYGKTGFTIGGEGFAEELLVVVPPSVSVTGTRRGARRYARDDIVQVSGTVRRYARAEIEQDAGVNLAAGIDYEEQEPVVIADRLYLTPRLGPALLEGQTPDTSAMPGIMDTVGTPGADGDTTTDGS